MGGGTPAVQEPGGSNQRLVNWDAAGDLSAWAVDRAREQWTRLVQK